MNSTNFGLWPFVVLLSIWAMGAFWGASIRRMAYLLGLVGAGIGLFYYSLDSSFWPLIYFLIYLIVFAAWLLMALTFPQAALRDDALEVHLSTSSSFMEHPSKWPWRRILRYFLLILLATLLTMAGLIFVQTLATLPAVSFASLTREDYFIDLAALSIFLLSNVLGLIFVFKTGAA